MKEEKKQHVKKIEKAQTWLGRLAMPIPSDDGTGAAMVFQTRKEGQMKRKDVDEEDEDEEDAKA